MSLILNLRQISLVRLNFKLCFKHFMKYNIHTFIISFDIFDIFCPKENLFFELSLG